MFFQLAETQISYASPRYKIRQFAERLPDGSVPVTGFNSLFCESSEHDYARTVARCLYFLAKQAKLEPHSSKLQSIVERKLDPHDPERILAVQSLFFAGMCEVPEGAGFSYAMEEFVELYYVVAPNGAINRSASFVVHAVVHLLYAIRGLYIVQCSDSVDAQQQVRWSETILNEQYDNALSGLQGLKRIATKCMDDPECRIVWLDEGLEVRTERGNCKVTPEDIRSMYYSFLVRGEAVLAAMDIPIISDAELDLVIDINSKVGGEGIMSMNTRIFENRLALKNGNTIQKSIQARKEFCNLSYELGKLLTMGLYLAGGPSARLTEIANWMVANSDDNPMRNLRLIRKLIVICNTYSKADALGVKSEGHLVCFSDKRLTALVLTYLIHVKRLEHDYSEIFGKEAQRNSRLCFLVHNGNLLKGPKLGLIFRHEFLKNNIDVSISDMRQVLEAYARKIGCLLQSEVINNPLLQLANHGTMTSNASYGKGNHDLPNIPADRMEECYLYCGHWNKIMLHSETNASTAAASVPLLPGHVGLCPAQLESETSSTATATHADLSIPLVAALSPSPPCRSDIRIPACSIEAEMKATQPFVKSTATAGTSKQSLKRRREVTLGDALQILDMKGLRPNQELAYNHLKENQGVHSLIILPTGTGKSKLIALDAITRGVCNILFVPYVAIKDEVLEEGRIRAGMNVESWSNIKCDYGAAANSAHIVIATAEQAGQSMIAFIQTLHRLDRLGCCFVDEADVLLQEYRALKMFWTFAASCKLVTVHAMTATLRPCDEVRLANTLGVDGLLVLRKSCIRADIDMSVRFFLSDHAMMRGLQLFLEGLSRTNTRIIIFMMTISAAEELGALLKLTYGDQVSVSHSLRKEILKRIAVVTSCFGHGVNIPGLTHVCIIRCSWSPEGLVQVR